MVRMYICMYTRVYLWSLETRETRKTRKKGMERRREERRGETREVAGRRKEEKRRRRIKGVEPENERGWSEKKRPVRVRETDGWERPTKNL